METFLNNIKFSHMNCGIRFKIVHSTLAASLCVILQGRHCCFHVDCVAKCWTNFAIEMLLKCSYNWGHLTIRCRNTERFTALSKRFFVSSPLQSVFPALKKIICMYCSFVYYVELFGRIKLCNLQQKHLTNVLYEYK